MKNICPNCKTEMKKNGYISDTGNPSLSYLQLVVKDDDLKKTKHELLTRYCPKCGHIEFYYEVDSKKA